MNLSIPIRINIFNEDGIIIQKIPTIREIKYAIDKRYKNGKIYKIFNETDTYYGSTILSLNNRLSLHKSHKNTIAKQIINNPPYKIEFIENYPCRNKYELEQREGFFQKNNKCININICGRTRNEWVEDNKDKIKQQQKEYYEDNKDKLKEQNKEYREKNNDKIKKQQKEYCEQNKDKLKEKNKEYREKNKDKVKERKKEYLEKNKDKINERQRKYRESLKFKLNN